MDSVESMPYGIWRLLDMLTSVPTWQWVAGVMLVVFGTSILTYLLLRLIVPYPRLPRTSEKQYISVLTDGSISKPQPLPCWYDTYAATKELAGHSSGATSDAYQIGEGEVFMTVVVPAFNEEKRLGGMLEEAIDYLQRNYATGHEQQKKSSNGYVNGRGTSLESCRGWEILIVSDGSTDKTVETALHFAQTHQLEQKHAVKGGPWTGDLRHAGIPADSIRVIKLEENRGKGGAVVHGMRHARGQYVVFADADGASKFSDLGKLVTACENAQDKQGRAVGVGSRAHMVGTDSVVKRSFLRNTLMRAFHLLIRTLTTPKTSLIADTQCGFKLFTRSAIPYIVPFMHSEGWIFDVEMLMLAESAGVPMVEVPIGWKEVVGSKLNVVWDSIGMAVGLALLRAGWGLGIYRND